MTQTAKTLRTEANLQASRDADEDSALDSTLDSIIQGHCLAQHQRCEQPVSTLAPFSLTQPHRCPSKQIQSATSIIPNLIRRQRNFTTKHSDSFSAKVRKFVNSRFRSWRIIRADDLNFTCACFGDVDKVYIGTQEGTVTEFNTGSLQECHQGQTNYSGNDTVVGLSVSKRGGKLLGSSAVLDFYINDFSNARCRIWDVQNLDIGAEPVTEINGAFRASFSNIDDSKIIASVAAGCGLYDVDTGTMTRRFVDDARDNHHSDRLYDTPRAVLSACDTMILSNQKCWDTRSGKCIHTFDRFGALENGVFHPTSPTVIIGACVWDLRNFALLQRSKDLAKTTLRFNNAGDVIYGISEGSFFADALLPKHTASQAHLYTMYIYTINFTLGA